VAYYGRDFRGVHLPFNFSLLSAPWHAGTIGKLIQEYEAALPEGGWPNWVLGNHDRPRITGRVGRKQARIAAMLLLTLRGTPTIYFGDEIGMAQVSIPPDRVRDPFQKNLPGIEVGRDGIRTPMQWDDTRYAGFSEVEPWLPLADDFREYNTVKQRSDPASIYHLYRQLIALRRSRSALLHGSYRLVHADGDLLLFFREQDPERLLVALNFGMGPAIAKFPDELAGTLLLSSHLDRQGEDLRGGIKLRPEEGAVIEIAGKASRQ
jgi:alpha-glucosidase